MKDACSAVAEFSSHIDKMNDLIKWQHQRSKMVVRKEIEMKTPMQGTSKEFKLQAELLEAAWNLKEKIMGPEPLVSPRDVQPVGDKGLDKFDLDKVYDKPGLTDTLRDPAKRMKIMNTIGRMFNTYSKAAESHTQEEVMSALDEKPIKPLQEAPETPGDESWASEAPVEIYKAPDAPTVVRNPFVDTSFNPEEYTQYNRRQPG